jgi:hypothetical protein
MNKMNKRQIIASLNNIANELDGTGLYKEANEITDVMVRLSQQLGYANMSELEQKNQIENWLSRASQLSSSQASQFNNQGTDKTDRNPGWDYIRGLKSKGLYPEVYQELLRQWNQIAGGGLATRKEPRKTTITTPGVLNSNQDVIKVEAWKFVNQALQDKSGNAWTNLRQNLANSPLFANNPNGQAFARRLFEYQLKSKGANPSLKPIQDQSLGK